MFVSWNVSVYFIIFSIFLYTEADNEPSTIVTHLGEFEKW